MNSMIEVIKKKKERKHEKEKGRGSADKDEPGALETPTEKEESLMKLLRVETKNLSRINKANSARKAGLKKEKEGNQMGETELRENKSDVVAEPELKYKKEFRKSRMQGNHREALLRLSPGSLPRPSRPSKPQIKRSSVHGKHQQQDKSRKGAREAPGNSSKTLTRSRTSLRRAGAKGSTRRRTSTRRSSGRVGGKRNTRSRRSLRRSSGRAGSQGSTRSRTRLRRSARGAGGKGSTRSRTNTRRRSGRAGGKGSTRKLF